MRTSTWGTLIGAFLFPKPWKWSEVGSHAASILGAKMFPGQRPRRSRSSMCQAAGFLNQAPPSWWRCWSTPEYTGPTTKKAESFWLRTRQGPKHTVTSKKKKKKMYWTFQKEFIPCLVNLELWAWLGPQTGDYGNLERKYQAISVTRTFQLENNSVSLYL